MTDLGSFLFHIALLYEHTSLKMSQRRKLRVSKVASEHASSPGHVLSFYILWYIWELFKAFISVSPFPSLFFPRLLDLLPACPVCYPLFQAAAARVVVLNAFDSQAPALRKFWGRWNRASIWAQPLESHPVGQNTQSDFFQQGPYYLFLDNSHQELGP